MTTEQTSDFASFGLPEPITKAILETGYATPTPIQQETIPTLLQGHDVVGLAQTGTGKTAAFALPLLAQLVRSDSPTNLPRALVLAPTRELAMQVCEALQTYAKHLPKVNILPIYGGASYKQQLDGLRKGADIVVGTPGRVIDHLDRKSLNLSALQTLVLDEADEMLRMGFIDDVENILAHTPETRQVVLFSATMPEAISKISQKYLNNPTRIQIASKTTTAPNIAQEYWQVDRGKNRKNTALKSFLTVKNFDAAIIFSRTKAGTEDIADQLGRWGYRAAALNGDMNQHQREKTVEQLKSGGLDIIVATDVAARGLDVKRISLVINYDMPQDVETYTHRIGRTGRAGASGAALLFVSPKERYMIRQIEKKTHGELTRISLPTPKELSQLYLQRWANQFQAAQDQQSAYQDTIHALCEATGMDTEQLAMAMAHALFTRTPLDPEQIKKAEQANQHENKASPDKQPRDRNNKPQNARERRNEKRAQQNHSEKDTGKTGKKLSLKKKTKDQRNSSKHPDAYPMERFRLAVGDQHGVQPKHIVGCIANEAGINGQYIQNITIESTHTDVDLPAGMPKSLHQQLRKARVLGHKIDIKKISD